MICLRFAVGPDTYISKDSLFVYLHENSGMTNTPQKLYAEADAKHYFAYIHIPKTAGTSLANALSNEAKLCFDYGPGNPRNSLEAKSELGEQFKIQPGVIYFGHFTERYLGTFKQRVVYFSWVRDPINRVVSSFLHVRRKEKLTTDLVSPNVLDALMIFVSDPAQRNIMSQYLGKSWRSFDFIGAVEYSAVSYSIFNKQLLNYGVILNPILLRTDNKNFKRNTLNYELPANVMSNIIQCNLSDIALYREVINKYLGPWI